MASVAELSKQYNVPDGYSEWRKDV